jgi:hypothetical protein
MPVERPIVATVVVPLAHVPPDTADDRGDVPPMHTPAEPVIVPPVGVTVTTVFVETVPQLTVTV